MEILEISKNEFDAVCYARNVHLMPLLQEVEYYKVVGLDLYGVIAKDLTDGDFGALVLGRDATKRFRAIDFGTKFYSTPKKALTVLKEVARQVGSGGNIHICTGR